MREGGGFGVKPKKIKKVKKVKKVSKKVKKVLSDLGVEPYEGTTIEEFFI